MSNIQALNHMDHSKIANAIKLLKNEIKYGASVDVNENKNKVDNMQNYCKNELTGQIYPFTKGSPEEHKLFRVMPLDGTEKIFFDSKDEYDTWFRKNRKSRTTYNPQHINGICT